MFLVLFDLASFSVHAVLTSGLRCPVSLSCSRHTLALRRNFWPNPLRRGSYGSLTLRASVPSGLCPLGAVNSLLLRQPSVPLVRMKGSWPYVRRCNPFAPLPFVLLHGCLVTVGTWAFVVLFVPLVIATHRSGWITGGDCGESRVLSVFDCALGESICFSLMSIAQASLSWSSGPAGSVSRRRTGYRGVGLVDDDVLERAVKNVRRPWRTQRRHRLSLEGFGMIKTVLSGWIFLLSCWLFRLVFRCGFSHPKSKRTQERPSPLIVRDGR